MSIGDRKVDVTPLCFKCGGRGHYVVVCPSKGLHFPIEEQNLNQRVTQRKKRPAMQMNLVNNVITMMV